MLGAFVLSLAGAIVTFVSVLAALDDEPLAALGLGERSRVAAFAAPGLATATPGSLATLRPVPATIEPVERTKPIAAPGEPSAGGATKSAWVPPIVRRAPKDPPPGTSVEEPAAVATAQAKPQKAPVRVPLPGLDNQTRSALGGPRSGSSAIAPAKQPPSPLPAKPGADLPAGP